MIYIITDTHGQDISESLKPTDLLIHLGDWDFGSLPNCRLILIKGNHDKYVPAGLFDLICEGILLDGMWLSHEPVDYLPKGAYTNLHGHLHNNKYEDYGYVKKPFHQLLKPNRLYDFKELNG